MNLRLNLLLIFVLKFNLNTFSQDLVLNGDFEDVNICSEAKIPCSPEAWRLTSSFLPLYSKKNNNYFVGITIYNSTILNYRSYLQSRLAADLIKGKKYHISLDVLAGEIPINKIGILFSDTLIHLNKNSLIKIKPEIEFIDKKKHIGNRKKWNKIEIEFVAAKNSSFIILGFFEPDKTMENIKRKHIQSQKDYYYYIDNISIIPIDTSYNTNSLLKVKELIYNQNRRHPVSKDLFNFNFDGNEFSYRTIDTITFDSEFLFSTNSFVPSEEQAEEIKLFFRQNKTPIDSIEIIGHTDNIGNDAYNLFLSEKRAEAISDIISSLNLIPIENLKSKGVGSSQPIYSNDTEEGKQRNRRVEIIIYYQSSLEKH
jgi:outer membrane protein OmpA-like peptidoglycan-associated protein